MKVSYLVKNSPVLTWLQLPIVILVCFIIFPLSKRFSWHLPTEKIKRGDLPVISISFPPHLPLPNTSTYEINLNMCYFHLSSSNCSGFYDSFPFHPTNTATYEINLNIVLFYIITPHTYLWDNEANLLVSHLRYDSSLYYDLWFPHHSHSIPTNTTTWQINLNIIVLVLTLFTSVLSHRRLW